MLEDILVKRLDTYIKIYKIIDERQHAYQKNKSINNLLGKFANKLYNNQSRNVHSLVLFLDFSTAFDLISHEKWLSCVEYGENAWRF